MRVAGARVNRVKMLAAGTCGANSMDMADDAPTLLSRIDAALTRIESATARRDKEAQAIRTRHTALKARMSEAVAALDDVLARGN